MKRLLALFALLALVLAPFAFAPASAAPRHESCSAMQQHKAPQSSPAEHGCCTPVISPLPDFAAAVVAPLPLEPPMLDVLVSTLPRLDSPHLELRPPRKI